MFCSLRSQSYKMMKSPLFWFTFLWPMPVVAVFVLYYSVAPWSVEGKLSGYFQALAIGMPCWITLLCTYIAQQEERAGAYFNVLCIGRSCGQTFFALFIEAAALSVVGIILYIVFLSGARKGVYTFADAEEKQVNILAERIAKEQVFDPRWVPSPILYTVFNRENRILSSNGTVDEQKRAQDFLDGKAGSSAHGYFVEVSYPEGTCVFTYHIGTRYASDWANDHLPRAESVFMLALLLIIVIPTMLFVRAIARRLDKDVRPLKHTVTLIGQGNLTYPVPHLSLKEFEDLGLLTERMRLDLKNTLETLWTREQHLKEKTAQMLHDYRTPLTVARANAEFLQEDLTRLENIKNKSALLEYSQAVILNLDHLTEVAERFEKKSTAREKVPAVEKAIAFDDFNQSIDKIGKVLSKHYGAQWQSRFQSSSLRLPVEETEMQQALTNIMVNAFEHGRSPQVVDIRFVLHEHKATYRITNTGSRFSEKALKQAMDKGFSEKKR